MIKLESVINTILQQLEHEQANETWKSRRRYFNQMLKCARLLGITEPCAKLYDAFISDDNNSCERHAMHIRCVKLVDAFAGTKAKDAQGIMFNEPPLPDETAVNAFFQDRKFPITGDVQIDQLIVKAEIEMRYLHLTDSTIGQYKHSWMGIRRYFYNAGVDGYSESLLKCYIKQRSMQFSNGSIKEWKWKIDRKAALVLMEVAKTGCFIWKLVNRDVSGSSVQIESIRSKYLDSLRQRNLSRSTIDLYDYVFRKFIAFAGIETPKDLQALLPQKIHLAITKFAGCCNRRSMATILPILRSLLTFFHTTGIAKKDLSGIVMGCFVQRSSVAAYLSEKDQAELVAQLEKESKRNKAIILLAMHLGLRDCDICNLTFQSIDWQNDKISLVQTKTDEPITLPLLPDIGNALMDYILKERPKRTDHYPYIFLREKAPHHKLSTVYLICSKLFSLLEIKPINGKSKGVKLFRYSIVHKLLAAKVPHQVITDVLGHTSKESDKPYLSMEDSMLKMCALDLSVIGRISWKEGALNG